MKFQRMKYFNLSILGFLGGFLSVGGGLAGCGYGLQGIQSSLVDKEHVHTVYVLPIINATYKAGVENTIYNNLVRALNAHRRVKVVYNRKEADAVLTGTVGAATYSGSAGSTVVALPPTTVGPLLSPNIQSWAINTIYNAVLSCSFSLAREKKKDGKLPATLWAASFSRTEPFPSANQLDVPGTTSPLINESEFERALADLAHSMMDDVNESMLAMF